jgi:hypothetical protein
MHKVESVLENEQHLGTWPVRIERKGGKGALARRLRVHFDRIHNRDLSLFPPGRPARLVEWQAVVARAQMYISYL